MPKRKSDYRSTLIEALRDRREAVAYLNAALEEDDDAEAFLAALRDVAEARQMAKVAEGAGVARETLYRMLSPAGNPTYKNLLSVIRALGLEFAGVREPGTTCSGTAVNVNVQKSQSLPDGRLRSRDEYLSASSANSTGLFLVVDNVKNYDRTLPAERKLIRKASLRISTQT